MPHQTMYSAYKTIKVPLRCIAKEPYIIEDIQEYVEIVNKIVIRGLILLRYYLISVPILPVLTEDFINAVLKTCCVQSTQGRPPSIETIILKNELKLFYDQIFEGIPEEPLHYTHLNTVLDYCSLTILTDIENNIKQRYVQYIESFVNHSFRLKSYLRNIQVVNDTILRNSLKYKYLQKLRTIKKDILNNELKSNGSVGLRNSLFDPINMVTPYVY